MLLFILISPIFIFNSSLVNKSSFVIKTKSSSNSKYESIVLPNILNNLPKVDLPTNVVRGWKLWNTSTFYELIPSVKPKAIVLNIFL